MIYFIGEYFNQIDEFENKVPEYINYDIGMKYEVFEVNIKELIENLIKNKFKKNNILITNNYTLQEEKKIKQICEKKNIYYLNVNLKSSNISDRSYEITEKLENNKVSNYEKLSQVYDQMQDRMEYDMYVPVFDKYISSDTTFLELGAGSGMVTNYLCKYNIHILATDLCEEFLNKLKTKNLVTPLAKVNCEVIDITKLNTYKFNNKFDYVGMFLDTLNYINILEFTDVFKNVSNILEDEGLFIFDIHKEEKLDIFHEYVEEVEFDKFKFHWMSIRETENRVSHNFTFINNDLSQEKHYQYIYPLAQYQKLYSKYFNEIEIIELEDRYIIVLERLK